MLVLFAFFTWVAIVISKRGSVGRAQWGWFIAAQLQKHYFTCKVTLQPCPWRKSFMRRASYRRKTFHRFPVDSKLRCKWMKWCLWRCRAAMKRPRCTSFWKYNGDPGERGRALYLWTLPLCHYTPKGIVGCQVVYRKQDKFGSDLLIG